MYGVDMSKPGAQAYYDSVFASSPRGASTTSRSTTSAAPTFQNLPEIEAIRRAIDRTGRPMVLSLSPGETALKAAAHVAAHANLWRISDDFWDRWLSLREQFARLENWNPHRKPGAWPDADMLPLGTSRSGARPTASPATSSTRDDPLVDRPLPAHARRGHDQDRRLHAVAAHQRRGAGRQPAQHRQPPALRPRRARRVDREGACERRCQKLFLVAAPVRQGDDTFQAVLWQAPRFVFRNGRERPLAEYRWTSAEAQWDSTSLTKDGLLAQATAIIEYAIPDGALRFKAAARFPKPGASASKVRVLTVVGTSANEDKRPGLPLEVALTDLGIAGEVAVRDLWTHTDLGKVQGTFSPVVPFHGARLFRLSRRSE
jgi:alpha-galactosidase